MWDKKGKVLRMPVFDDCWGRIDDSSIHVKQKPRKCNLLGWEAVIRLRSHLGCLVAETDGRKKKRLLKRRVQF